MAKAKTVAEVIAAEAGGSTKAERLAEMRAIASVIANRAEVLGVTQEQVVQDTREFNAYGKAMPPGTAGLVGMAEQAAFYVSQMGPINKATFYALPSKVGNLPKGLEPVVTDGTKHSFFSDPKGRAIRTSVGFKTPDMSKLESPDVETVPSAELAGVPTRSPRQSPQQMAKALGFDVVVKPDTTKPKSDMITGLMNDIGKAAKKGQSVGVQMTGDTDIDKAVSGLLGRMPGALNVSPIAAAPSNKTASAGIADIDSTIESTVDGLGRYTATDDNPFGLAIPDSRQAKGLFAPQQVSINPDRFAAGTDVFGRAIDGNTIAGSLRDALGVTTPQSVFGRGSINPARGAVTSDQIDGMVAAKQDAQQDIDNYQQVNKGNRVTKFTPPAVETLAEYDAVVNDPANRAQYAKDVQGMYDTWASNMFSPVDNITTQTIAQQSPMNAVYSRSPSLDAEERTATLVGQPANSRVNSVMADARMAMSPMAAKSQSRLASSPQQYSQQQRDDAAWSNFGNMVSAAQRGVAQKQAAPVSQMGMDSAMFASRQPSFISSKPAQSLVTPTSSFTKQESDLAAQYGMYTNPNAKAYYSPVDGTIPSVIGPNPQTVTPEEAELNAGRLAAEQEAERQRALDPTPAKKAVALTPEKRGIIQSITNPAKGFLGSLLGNVGNVGGIFSGRESIDAGQLAGIVSNAINATGRGDLTTGRGIRTSSSGLGTSVTGGPSANFDGYDAHTNNFGVTTVSNDNMSFIDNSDGGAAGGNKVLCTHYHSIGWLSDEVYAADSLCGLAMPVGVVASYHWWAKPLVKQIKKRKWLELVLWPPVKLWAHSMHWRFRELSHG